MRITFISILFISVFSSAVAQVRVISGTVRDQRSEQPMPFANIRIKNTGIGTLSNAQGDYILKVPSEHFADTLEISFVGYQTVFLPVPSGENNMMVALAPAVHVLNEITVNVPSGLGILREAIRRIPVNYDTTGKRLQAFYREQINLNKDTISFVEAVVDVYRGSYTNELDKDQARFLKGRARSDFNWKGDPLYGWLSGLSNGIRGSLAEDLVKQLVSKNNPLYSNNFISYRFHLEDILFEGRRKLYVISFGPLKPNRSRITVDGRIFIDEESYAIERIDFTLTPGGIKYLNRHRGVGYRIMTVAYQAGVSFTGIHEVISFSRNGEKWTLKEVSKQFTAEVTSGKRSFHQAPWEANTLFVVTDVSPGKGEKITEGDIINSPHSVGTLSRYKKDEAFWENYNVVKPTGVDSIRRKKTPEPFHNTRRVSGRVNGFTRADSLQGTLNPLRKCYDVSFYHLDVTVNPANKSIAGSSTIRFRTVTPFSKMQIDLYANMQIDRILYRDQELRWEREFNAVYVYLPKTLAVNSIEEIVVFYHGVPKEPDFSVSMDGGFLWKKDVQGKPWIMSVCQGDGASVWWPNKDHLSDEPDSSRITVTVPKGLMDISNGRLRSVTDLPNQTRFDWYVSYPINNYNIVLNIGDYRHERDYRVHGIDSLSIDYYFKPEHEERAHRLFREVRPALKVFEEKFGPFPFPHDGVTVMESLYPMEHQSAVSIGPLEGTVKTPMDAAPDSLIHQVLLWHELAHEWWGNNISITDMADFWIHEGFATYAEALVMEMRYGYEAAADEINRQVIGNKTPIIGIYGVNHIHDDIGDLYNKSCLMLNTLRHVVNNDSLWFATVRKIQQRFWHGSVTTPELITFMNKELQNDYTYFFDQYLRYPALPNLVLKYESKPNGTLMRYKWEANVKDFRMPVKVETSEGHFELIYPITTWKELLLRGMAAGDVEIAEDDFYITVEVE